MLHINENADLLSVVHGMCHKFTFYMGACRYKICSTRTTLSKSVFVFRRSQSGREAFLPTHAPPMRHFSGIFPLHRRVNKKGCCMKLQQPFKPYSGMEKRKYFNLCQIIQLAAFISCNETLDTLIGIQQVADGSVMVQCVNEVCDIFAHIAVDVPFF